MQWTMRCSLPRSSGAMDKRASRVIELGATREFGSGRLMASESERLEVARSRCGMSRRTARS